MADEKETVVHILWINAGLSCDGDSVALTAAMQPSIEDIVFGTLPGLPKVSVHWPLIAPDTGPVGSDDDFIEWFFKGERGELGPFVLVIEGVVSANWWKSSWHQPSTSEQLTESLLTPPPFVN
jgi:hydrogenase small subunit